MIRWQRSIYDHPPPPSPSTPPKKNPMTRWCIPSERRVVQLVLPLPQKVILLLSPRDPDPFPAQLGAIDRGVGVLQKTKTGEHRLVPFDR